MAEAATRLPIKTEEKRVEEARTGRASALKEWRPFENLRNEIDHLFDELDRGWRSPFRQSIFDIGPLWPRELNWRTAPAVDIAEKDKSYEITAELPGIDEKNIEIKIANGALTVKGEKSEEKEEKKKDYYLSERRFGAFERAFRVPDGVDVDKIEASFKKGVLTVTLPKKPEAMTSEKKITIKAA